MNFLRDRHIRNTFICLIVLLLLLLLCGWVIVLWQESAVDAAFLEYSRNIVGSLSQQGVPDAVIATAMMSRDSASQGISLLNQIGVSQPSSVQFVSWGAITMPMLMIWIALCAALLGSAFFFIRKRELLFENATQIISRFIEGDFSDHLPRLDEGAVYLFFAAVDQLATILQAKNDSQEKTKAFLKSTISDISHQLKTPLAALSMYNEIILDEPEQIDTVKHYAQKTAQALERMESLIGSMLKITRLDAGSIDFEKEPVNVRDLIAHATRELTARADNEHKQILIDGASDEKLTCDAMWTSEAIGNIVKNALDHTQSGGIIKITWERSPAMLRISISDNGSGIASEDIHHIFARFYRSKKTLDTPGVGLGLPLAKSIVEGQDGMITAQSDLGVGTTFILSFLTEL